MICAGLLHVIYKNGKPTCKACRRRKTHTTLVQIVWSGCGMLPRRMSGGHRIVFGCLSIGLCWRLSFQARLLLVKLFEGQ